MCEIDLGTCCLLEAQAVQHEHTNLCLYCVCRKIRIVCISFDRNYVDAWKAPALRTYPGQSKEASLGQVLLTILSDNI